MLRNKNLLFNSQGGDGGAGGGGSAAGGAGANGDSGNNAGASAGGGFLPGQGSGAAGDGANAGQAPAGAAPSSASAPTVNFPENWKLGLPAELQEDSSLKIIHDIPGLAKSYINAQKLIGVDKIPVPGKHATEDDWKNVYQKLGLPKDAKDYKVDVSADSGLHEEFVKSFTETAFDAGVLPKAASALMGALAERNKAVAADMEKAAKAKFDADVAGLRSEWGAGFDVELAKANAALTHFATPEEIKILNDSGLTQNTTLIKLFNKMSKTLGEDVINVGSGNPSGGMTPAAAQSEINTILGNSGHPYYAKDHPNHGAAVLEVQKLFQMANKK